MQKFLIFVALLGTISAFPIKQDSLNNIYKRLIPAVESIVKNINHECVQNKLNLPKNGNKIVKGEQGLLLLTFAAYLCSDELAKPRMIEKISELKELMRPLDPNVKKCMKTELWKIEPNSPLLDNFENDVTENDENNCKQSKEFTDFLQFIDRMWSMAEQLLGEDIKKCRNEEAEKKNMFSLLALVDENRTEVKNAELEKYINAEMMTQDSFFQCAMKPVEDMHAMNSIDGDRDDEED